MPIQLSLLDVSKIYVVKNTVVRAVYFADTLDGALGIIRNIAHEKDVEDVLDASIRTDSDESGPYYQIIVHYTEKPR